MKTLRWHLSFLLVALALTAPGCANKSVATKPAVEVITPAWVRTELYFSIGDWTDTALSTEAESRWATFLDQEVTPRFTSGLSVLDVYAQGRGPAVEAVIKRERSRLLVIVHPATAEASAKIDTIRAAWKRLGGEAPVLRISQPADVSF